MSLAMDFFIYFLIWWVLLFTVLPFGITTHDEAGRGFDAGAPVKTNLKKKMLINSLLAAVVVGIIHVLVAKGIIDWDSFFEGAWK